MAANLITKLILQDADFAKKLQKNKKEVSAFASGGAKAFGTVASVVGKFAAGVGVAMSGVEAFNKVMNSSQTLADAWGGVMEAAKTSVDNFFYAIGSGDFSPFLGGLDAVISRAREAYAAMDDLGNVTMSYNYAQAQDQAKLTELMNTARDEGLSQDVRASALKEAQALSASMQKNAAEYSKTVKEAYLKQLGSKVGVTDTSLFTKEMLEQALRLDISADRGQLREQLAGRKAAYDAEISALSYKNAPDLYKKTMVRGALGDYEAFVETDAYHAKVAEVQKKYADTLVQWAALEMAADEELSKIGQAVMAAENAIRTAASTERALLRVEKQLKAALPQAAGEVFSSAPRAAATSVEGFDFAADISAQEKRKKEESARWAAMGVPEKLGEIPLAKVPDEAKSGVDGYTDSILQLGGAFSQLGASVSGAEGALLSWLGASVDAAAQVANTIAMLAAEEAAHNANANAATADAAAKAMASTAGIPFAGIAMGLSAVAAIIGAMRSIPKFATGGVVTAPTIGLVGEAGPEAIIPLTKLDKIMSSSGAREVRIVGTLRARGKDLVGTIDNYESVKNVR